MGKQKVANPYNEILFGLDNEYIPKFPPGFLPWRSSATVDPTPCLTGQWVDSLCTEQGQSVEGHGRDNPMANMRSD